MGLTFYSHINEYTDNFLSDHNYSRQEIQDGIIRFYKRIYNRRNELPITLSDTRRNVIKQKHESGNE